MSYILLFESNLVYGGQDHDDMYCKNQDRNEAISCIDCGYVEECCVASTIEHNRFSIVRVCQASDDIQFPYIALFGGVIQLAVL